MNANGLKEQAEHIRQAHAGQSRVPWPSGFKNKLVELIESGQTAKSLSEVTGISHQLISQWAPKKRCSTLSSFRQIQLTSEHENKPLSLKWTGGLEVSSLSFSQFRELLREGLL